MASDEISPRERSIPATLSPSEGADPQAPPAVRGKSAHPEHLLHGGGYHQFLSTAKQWNSHHFQDQHSPGFHCNQSQSDG